MGGWAGVGVGGVLVRGWWVGWWCGGGVYCGGVCGVDGWVMWGWVGLWCVGGGWVWGSGLFVGVACGGVVGW